VRFLLEPATVATLGELARSAEAARAAGLDGLFLRTGPSLPAPLVAAAAIAARVEDVLVAAEIEVGLRHPVEIAEEAAVVDLVSGGRLVVVARPALSAPEGSYAESLDLLRLSWGAAPFRFEGAHWRVPANLPENVHQAETRARVTPAPAQTQLALWASGDGVAEGAARGLGVLADPDAEDEAVARAVTSARPVPGAPCGRCERWTDAPSLVARLRAGREAFGQDWAAVLAPDEAVEAIGALVRPRVQLDRLTPGLEAFWDEARPWQHRTRRS
jgi:alkanesulfonate monooxygenase SsuD/methylene tetrahydromethanopterin reductase-like flavin-dependent oxidoreductase (luciferase family)